MADSLSGAMAPSKPTLKLYEKDFKGVKSMDVDDKCCFHIKVKAISKYHEDWGSDGPLCITFDVVKVTKCEED